MKKFVLDFVRRGLMACGFGPIVLSVLYLILQSCGIVDLLIVNQVCLGIISLSVLAFIAGAMNAVYQLERLPLMLAILIHGVVLYISYLITYLINDWLAWGITPVLIFSLIFVVGYLAIWVIIYVSTRRNAKMLSAALKDRQHGAEKV